MPEKSQTTKKHKDYGFAIEIRSIIMGARRSVEQFPSLLVLEQDAYEKWYAHMLRMLGRVPDKDRARCREIFQYYFNKEIVEKMRAIVAEFDARKSLKEKSEVPAEPS